MRRDRCGYGGGGGLAVKANGRDNTPKDTPARETALRLYAGRREMALANVLGSTSRTAPILRAVASFTGPPRSALGSEPCETPEGLANASAGGASPPWS
jgi:hypothetical protein